MNVPRTFNEISLSMIMQKKEGNDRLSPDSIQKYHYKNIQLAKVFTLILDRLVKRGRGVTRAKINNS